MQDPITPDRCPDVLLLVDSLAASGFETALTAHLQREGLHARRYTCADAWLWDPCGALTRSLLVEMHLSPTLREVWIVGGTRSTATASSLPFDNNLGRSDRMATWRYLMEHWYHVNPDEWFRSDVDPVERVRSTLHLLSSHPLRRHDLLFRSLWWDGTGILQLHPAPTTR